MARHKNLAGHADLTNMGSPCFFLKGHVENLMDWDLMRTSGTIAMGKQWEHKNATMIRISPKRNVGMMQGVR